ncbi:MAG: DUF3192 domain-containing protein [Desulfobaccales bacterium]
MRRWRFSFGLLLLLGLSGCAGPGGGVGSSDTLRVGQREADLLARHGQPQEVQPVPAGGKIYIYTSYGLEQTAAMGGGAWNRLDQIYYWLDDQGVITKVARYPYGKRKFLFPSPEKVLEEPQVTTASPSPPRAAAPPLPQPPAVKAAQPSPEPPGSAVTAQPPTPPTAAVAPPAPKSLPRGDMAAAASLELNMSREEVRALLGSPERTEGFKAQGRALIVWFYLLESRPGRRVLTPVVFEDGRLSGWGEDFYKRRLRDSSGQGF